METDAAQLTYSVAGQRQMIISQPNYCMVLCLFTLEWEASMALYIVSFITISWNVFQMVKIFWVFVVVHANTISPQMFLPLSDS